MFLDLELMRLMHRISAGVKFGGGVAKQLLIDAMGPELPEQIWNRPKQGFTFPFEQWMRGSDITAPQSSAEQALFAQFARGGLSWGRYWCALLANRFACYVPA